MPFFESIFFIWEKKYIFIVICCWLVVNNNVIKDHMWFQQSRHKRHHGSHITIHSSCLNFALSKADSNAFSWVQSHFIGLNNTPNYLIVLSLKLDQFLPSRPQSCTPTMGVDILVPLLYIWVDFSVWVSPHVVVLKISIVKKNKNEANF